MVIRTALPYEQVMKLLERNLSWVVGENGITVRYRGGYVGWSNGRGLLHRCEVRFRIYVYRNICKIVGHECGHYPGLLESVMKGLEMSGGFPSY